MLYLKDKTIFNPIEQTSFQGIFDKLNIIWQKSAQER